MNRIEIKEKAKEMIRGNKLILWKPLLVIFAVTFAVAFVIGIIAGAAGANLDTITSIFSSLAGFAVLPATVGTCAYYLKFVRGEEYSLDLLKKYYPVFVKILVIDLLVSIFTILWSLLLIVPGIIAAISYSMAFFIVIDKEELTASETIKESKRIMNGHKLDFFVLQLSFLGWYIVACLTLGILFIWLVPYMTIANVLFYEDVRKQAE